MEMNVQDYLPALDSWLIQHLIHSVVWLVVIVLLRVATVRALLRWEKVPAEMRRRWVVHTRLAFLLVFFAGLFFLWAEQLQTLALSLVAVAIAVVIGTKELLLCLLGGVLRAGSREFAVGDRIVVNNLRGDVIDLGLFTTTILEIGSAEADYQHTGRTIVIPNAVFLSAALANETFMEDYSPHIFTVPVRAGDDWQAAEAALLEAARAECRQYEQGAREHMAKIKKEHGLEPPPIEPRVSLQMPEPGRVNLSLAVTVPTRWKGQVEQAILRRFLVNYRAAPAS